MNNTSEAMLPEFLTEIPSVRESNTSGVSWGAVIAGAFVAAALALVLTILGVGLGLSSTSPWAGSGASAATLGVSAIVWLVVTQAIAAGLGGYLTGRLRIKWARVHNDEVYFRDTAHGFLVWAVGVVITVAFLASAASTVVGTAAKATGAAAGVAAAVPASTGSVDRSIGGQPSAMTYSSTYLTDSLFRNDRASPSAAQDLRPEVGRILAEALRRGTLPTADRTYAAQVVASRTGMSQADAELRVDAVYAQSKSIMADAELAARTVADDVRRSAAKTSLWFFVALLCGAFCASFAATIGGRQRDNVDQIDR